MATQLVEISSLSRNSIAGDGKWKLYSAARGGTVDCSWLRLMRKRENFTSEAGFMCRRQESNDSDENRLVIVWTFVEALTLSETTYEWDNQAPRRTRLTKHAQSWRLKQEWGRERSPTDALWVIANFSLSLLVRFPYRHIHSRSTAKKSSHSLDVDTNLAPTNVCMANTKKNLAATLNLWFLSSHLRSLLDDITSRLLTPTQLSLTFSPPSSFFTLRRRFWWKCVSRCRHRKIMCFASGVE
jgi:hypothetical protein